MPVEVFVQQDFCPHRHPERAFGYQPRDRWGRDDPWELRTATPLGIALPLDTTDMGLDLDFNDGGGFGARKGLESFPTAWAALLRRAQGADFVDDGERGTGTATVPRTAGLLSALTGAHGWGFANLIGTRRFFAFRPVQALGEVTDRGLIGFDFRLQGHFPFRQLFVLHSPVIRLPLQFDIGLFR